MAFASLGLPGSPAMIEPATWRDLNALRRLEQVAFSSDAWPLWDLIGVLTLSGVVRLKAVMDGDMVGFIAGEAHPSESQAWITTVCVHPDFRRRGIGASLILACEQRFPVSRVRLSVRVSNVAAIRLYQSLGYQKADLWRRYYMDGEDALVMEKALS